VTPSLNQGPFIREAIESVLGQTYSNIEYIIMDAGSNDETHDVAAEFGGRLRYISEPDRGQSHAINKGWRMANGEILGWLCADDTLLPDAVQEIVDAFAIHPTAVCVFGGCEAIDLHGASLGVSGLCRPDTWKLIHGFDYVPQPSAFATRGAIEAVGFVDESLYWGMDWDLFIRLSKLGQLIAIAPILSQARIYPETKTQSGGIRRWRELVRIMRDHGEMRYPPGYFLYGAETLRDVAKPFFERRRGPAAYVSKRIVAGLESASERVRVACLARAGRGWFDDGWAGPSVSVDVPSGAESMTVRGRVPPEHPEVSSQELTFTFQGEVLATVQAAPGPFSFDVMMSKPTAINGALMKITASRSFVPKRSGLNGDARRLAYYLDDLEANVAV